VPGKVPALEERFRDASKLQAKHNLNVIGYWYPMYPAWANTLLHRGCLEPEERNKLDEFHADPEFQKYVKSEHATS